MIVNCETFADGSFAAVPLMQSSWSVLAEILLSSVCMLEAEFPRWKSVRVWAPSLAEWSVTSLMIHGQPWPELTTWPGPVSPFIIFIITAHLSLSWTLLASTSLSHSVDLARLINMSILSIYIRQGTLHESVYLLRMFVYRPEDVIDRVSPVPVRGPAPHHHVEVSRVPAAGELLRPGLGSVAHQAGGRLVVGGGGGQRHPTPGVHSLIIVSAISEQSIVSTECWILSLHKIHENNWTSKTTFSVKIWILAASNWTDVDV